MDERNDETAARILRELKEIRVELRGARGARGEMRNRFDGLDGRVEGVERLVTRIVGATGRLERRVARLEGAETDWNAPAP